MSKNTTHLYKPLNTYNLLTLTIHFPGFSGVIQSALRPTCLTPPWYIETSREAHAAAALVDEASHSRGYGKDLQKNLSNSTIDIAPLRKPIPNVQSFLSHFRRLQFPIYHTREGHRPDLSTLPPRELFRSRNNPSKIGIGEPGPLGRLLIRGSKGQTRPGS